MKTIKELEAVKKELDIPEANNEITGRIFALKDILGLIDVRLKQNDRAKRCGSISQAQYDWTYNELIELKARVTG